MVNVSRRHVNAVGKPGSPRDMALVSGWPTGVIGSLTNSAMTSRIRDWPPWLQSRLAGRVHAYPLRVGHVFSGAWQFQRTGGVIDGMGVVGGCG